MNNPDFKLFRVLSKPCSRVCFTFPRPLLCVRACVHTRTHTCTRARVHTHSVGGCEHLGADVWVHLCGAQKTTLDNIWLAVKPSGLLVFASSGQGLWTHTTPSSFFTLFMWVLGIRLRSWLWGKPLLTKLSYQPPRFFHSFPSSVLFPKPFIGRCVRVRCDFLCRVRGPEKTWWPLVSAEGV